MNKQTTYFLLRIDHPENVNVDGLRARMEGGRNIISLQVLEHSDTFSATDAHGELICPYIAF